MIGLQGNGKTTTVAKLGNYYKKRGYKIGVVCADTFRAAAFDQLQQNCARCRLHFFGMFVLFFLNYFLIILLLIFFFKFFIYFSCYLFTFFVYIFFDLIFNLINKKNY